MRLRKLAIKVIKNPYLLFTGNRYFGFFIQFIRGILVAKFLGPELFGIWGFLSLMNHYLVYANLGLESAVNVELATTDDFESSHTKNTIGPALSITTLIGVVLVMAGTWIQFGDLQIFDKYEFSRYAFLLSISVGFFNVQQILINVYRVRGEFLRIAIVDLLRAAMPLAAVFLFPHELLIQGLLISMVTSGVIGTVVLLFRSPFPLAWSSQKWGKMLGIGLPLMVYSLSFYLIQMAAHTMVGYYYSVKTMGLFSLAVSITNAFMLGINTIVWVALPEMISRLREGIEPAIARSLIEEINWIYGSLVFLFVFAIGCSLPIFFVILPQYEPAHAILLILLLSKAALLASFGFNAFSMARKEQVRMATNSFVSFTTVVLLSFLVVLFKLDSVWIAMAIFLGSILFTYLQGRATSELIGETVSSTYYFFQAIPLSTLLILIFALAVTLFGNPFAGALIGFLLYIILSRERLAHVVRFAKEKLSISS